MMALAEAPGVFDVCGSSHRSARWRTNAPWVQALTKRDPVRPPHSLHPPAVLQVLPLEDYPRGWCQALAKEYLGYTGGANKVGRVMISEAGTSDPLSPSTRRSERERENIMAVGGLRCPLRSLTLVPGWCGAGARIRAALDVVVDNNIGELETMFKLLGKGYAGIPDDIVQEARSALANTLGTKPRKSKRGRIRADLVAAMSAWAEDPDDVIAEWLSGSTPLGIKNKIQTRGIFPKSEKHGGQDATMEEAMAACCLTEQAGNYQSTYDHLGEVAEELSKERDKGFLVWSPEKQILQQEVGKLILSRVGAVVTTKHGHVKTRLIHDLRRSRVNGMTQVPERVILPRLIDAAESACAVMREAGAADMVVMDFSDAFKHVPITHNERRFMAGQAKLDGQEGYFYYRVLLFGAVAGPLLWGRVAAWLMRASAGVSAGEPLQLQCFVDDPILVVGGQEVQKIRAVARVFLLWSALNFQLAWAKAQSGPEVEWIGAKLKLKYQEGKPYAVEITIDDKKIEKLANGARELQAPWIRREKVKEYAGLCSWAGSVVPSLKPYVQMLWATASAKPAGSESKTWCAGQRVALATTWILAMLCRRSQMLRRLFLVHQPDTTVIIVFDASLTGGGATLLDSSGDDITDFIVTCWDDWDHATLCAEEGNPRHQAEWETYMLLLACATWLPKIHHSSRLLFRGDAKGILQSVLARRARNPRINLIVAEIQLTLSISEHLVEAEHIWSEKNEVCDALSRRGEGQAFPAEVQGARQWSAARNNFRILEGSEMGGLGESL